MVFLSSEWLNPMWSGSFGNLDSGFQSLVDSGFQKQKIPGFRNPDSLTWGNFYVYQVF